MAKNAFLCFLNGYEEPDVVNGRSVTGKRFFLRSYSGKMRASSQGSGAMRPIGAMRRGLRALAFTPAKIYGAFAITFGLLSLILYFLRDYFSVGAQPSTSALIIGAVFSIIAVPLLLFDKPIALLAESFVATDFIFFEFFGIKRPYGTARIRRIQALLFVLLGAALAGVGFFVPLWTVAVGILGFVFLLLSFLSPEFAFFSSLLLLPYYGIIPYAKIVLSVIIGVAVVSFLRKSVAGKRVIFFEQYDLIIALMLVLVVASGIFISDRESTLGGLLLFVMALGYFLASNIVTNRRLADSAVGAISVSSIPVSLFAIGEAVYTVYTEGGFSSSLLGIKSTFPSADAFAVFLIVAIIFSAVLINQTKGGVRAAFLGILIIDVVALLLTAEIFSITALLIGVLAYFALKARAWSALILPILFLIPYGVFLLPGEISGPIFELIPTSLSSYEIRELWRSSLLLIRENPFGIGIGEGSFASAMSALGIEGVADASNLFIQFALDSGVLALFMLILLLAVRLRHIARYHSYVKNSQLETLAPAVAVCVFSLLCYGAADYIFSDVSMFYLFWCVFGLGSAALRVSKKEHDDRVLYFEDTRRTYSSSVSVSIK